MIFVSVNTPTKTFGHGAGRLRDLGAARAHPRHQCLVGGALEVGGANAFLAQRISPINSISALGERYGLDEVARYWDAVVSMNEYKSRPEPMLAPGTIRDS